MVMMVTSAVMVMSAAMVMMVTSTAMVIMATSAVMVMSAVTTLKQPHGQAEAALEHLEQRCVVALPLSGNRSCHVLKDQCRDPTVLHKGRYGNRQHRALVILLAHLSRFGGGARVW